MLCECRKIEFPPDSELKTIEEHAFGTATIESFSLPSQVTHIGNGAFSLCHRLRILNIQPDSELRTIEGRAFSFTSITSVYIPSHVTDIGKGAFDCGKLQIIEFSQTPNILHLITSFLGKSTKVIIMIPA